MEKTTEMERTRERERMEMEEESADGRKRKRERERERERDTERRKSQRDEGSKLSSSLNSIQSEQLFANLCTSCAHFSPRVRLLISETSFPRMEIAFPRPSRPLECWTDVSEEFKAISGAVALPP